MSEWQNGLQAASNAVAGNVAGPVDIIAWLLRKAGMPVPPVPVGGSDWMREQGLMRDVRPGASQVVGETLGLLGPMAGVAKAPQIAKTLLQGGDNLAVPRTLNLQTGAIVYHGSPHKFDKFDSSKIGTGEGAQAYGHGLYLADSPGVAKNYQRALSGISPEFKPNPKFNVNQLYEQARSLFPNDAAKQDAWHALAQKHDWTDPVEVAKWGKEMAYTPEAAAAVDDVISKIYNPGALYKVDLPDSAIAKMLDWDKPLSQQAPEVRNAVMATRKTLTPYDIENLGGAAGVRALYDPANKIDNFLGTWESLRGKRDAGEVLLRQQGIPGIRYLDGGSRSAGAGSSNYVVFPGEEGLLKILERNGQGLLP